VTLLSTGTPKRAPQQPAAPVAWDNSGAMRAKHWPLGVPARQPVRPFADMAAIEADVPNTRAGTWAPPSTGWGDFPPMYDVDRNKRLAPYRTAPAAPSTTKNVTVLAGGPGSTPYFAPMPGNLPANFNYEYRVMGADREQDLLPRLDGNRHVPNPVIVDPGMAGDVGVYHADYTLNSFVGQYPAYNSNSYVTTSAQGTNDSPGQSGIPDHVVMAADPIPAFDPLASFL